VQDLAAYTNPESHNAQRHRQTDGRTDRQTDGQQAAANSRSYCVAVRSAKTGKNYKTSEIRPSKNDILTLKMTSGDVEKDTVELVPIIF